MDLAKNEQEPESSKELRQLREENLRLQALLKSYGLAREDVRGTVPEPATAESPSTATRLTTGEKIARFRRLFRGRGDVYPVRWQSAKGSAGYSPACGPGWKPGICHKPKVRCGDCSQRLLLPVTDQVLFDHLSGKHTVGVYPSPISGSCQHLPR